MQREGCDDTQDSQGRTAAAQAAAALDLGTLTDRLGLLQVSAPCRGVSYRGSTPPRPETPMLRDLMPTPARISHSPATEVDRYVCRRIRERRIMLGLTQLELAERIGATHQQTQRYEAGTSRIFAGRLFMIAQALDVDVGYFVDGMTDRRSLESLPHSSAFFELTRNFISMAGIYKKAIIRFAREMADRKPALVYDIKDGRPRQAGTG